MSDPHTVAAHVTALTDTCLTCSIECSFMFMRVCWELTADERVRPEAHWGEIGAGAADACADVLIECVYAEKLLIRHVVHQGQWVERILSSHSQCFLSFIYFFLCTLIWGLCDCCISLENEASVRKLSFKRQKRSMGCGMRQRHKVMLCICVIWAKRTINTQVHSVGSETLWIRKTKIMSEECLKKNSDLSAWVTSSIFGTLTGSVRALCCSQIVREAENEIRKYSETRVKMMQSLSTRFPINYTGKDVFHSSSLNTGSCAKLPCPWVSDARRAELCELLL